MNYKFNVFGLAFVAVLAMGAFSTSAAMAGEFHSESSTQTVVKGEEIGTGVLTVNAGTVKCNEARLNGTQVGATSTTVKLTPEYGECTAFGFVSTKIDSKQCTYEFSGDNGNVVLSCPAGEPMTVTAFNCWVTIGSQTSAGGITYTNVGSGSSRHYHVKMHVVGTTYTQDSKSFPGCSGGARTDGTEVREYTIKCYSIVGIEIGCWRV